ncbi:DUF6881 domain-containing protein [Deinococcus radiophilus]
MNVPATFELVQWWDAPPEEPRFIAAELDGQRYELRKIELFRDGTVMRLMSERDLAEVPWPPLAELAADEDEVFLSTLLTAEEFETLWADPSLQRCEEIRHGP